MFKLTLYWLVVFAFISAEAKGQSKLINGFLLDSITHFPIDNGTVNNTTNKKIAFSDEKGFFRIQAAPGDFIYASAKSYRYDTLNYSFIFTDTITFYLSPSGNILPTVTVAGRYNKYQLDSIERRTSFNDDMGRPMKTLSNNHPSGFGLTFNLDKVFSNKNKYRKRDENAFEAREKMQYVDYRFSPQVVAYYTRFKGDLLKDFLHQSTPGYNWLRQHPFNEDVMYYINDKLKAYRAKAAAIK